MLLYTRLAHQAIADMARRLPELRHVDPERLAVVAGARAGGGIHGNLAQCCALHERESDHQSYWYQPTTRQVLRVTPWTRRVNTRIVLHGVEMRYLIVLKLPRFLLHHPLETLVHELLHIGPAFDGRLRRLRHGRRFEAIVHHLAAQWARTGDPALVEPLRTPPAELETRWGRLVGAGFAAPFSPSRLVPLDNPPPLDAHPDFRRLGLRCDPAQVEVVQPPRSSDRPAPGLLTERDLVYRVYAEGAAHRLSAAALRASRDLYPPLQD